MVVPGGVDRSGEFRVIPCLLWLIERLARQHELHVFALYQEPHPSRYELLGAVVHNIGMRQTVRRAVRTIVEEHRRGRFDVLHAFWVKGPGTIAAMAGLMLRRPVIVHVAGGELISLPAIEYGGRRSLKGRVAVQIALRGASRVTAACRPIIDECIALGVQAERFVLGVDLERWPAVEPRRRDGETPLRMLHVASLNKVKDQPTLLHAAARLRDSGVAFTLDIVGSDTLGGESQNLVRSLSLENQVTFHGFLPHARLRPMFDDADLLVLSSLHEGGEVVTLEAAVAGVPAVGTRVGRIAEWAPDAAVAVAVGDVTALAREIRRIGNDETSRLRLAREAQQIAVAHDADATARQADAMYHELADGQDGKRSQ